MEEAASVRRAALNAVTDVEPARLHERIESRVTEGSMAPGVLVLLSASAVGDGVGPDGVEERAAGVQLIYEGLRLTRSLAHEQPWADGDSPGAWHPPADVTTNGEKPPASAAADIDILVADILVARGFYLLARTEAAGAAVEVVRSFGRDQTVRRETDDPSLDRNLEADVFELAVVAGTTAAGGSAPLGLREYAIDLVDGPAFPPAERLFGDAVTERLATLVDTDPPSPEGARTSADH